MTAKLSVFVAYAHKDNEPAECWLDRLLTHLKPLSNKIDAWSDKRIAPGDRWHEKIKVALEASDAALLLVSPDFLASDFIATNELPPLLRKAFDAGKPIIPIIVGSCLFLEKTFKYPDPINGPHVASLSEFQAANPPSKPLRAMAPNEQDEVFVKVARVLLEKSTNPR